MDPLAEPSAIAFQYPNPQNVHRFNPDSGSTRTLVQLRFWDSAGKFEQLSSQRHHHDMRPPTEFCGMALVKQLRHPIIREVGVRFWKFPRSNSPSFAVTMAIRQTFRDASLLGFQPKRPRFLASPGLTFLILLAALVQFVPAGLASSSSGFANTGREIWGASDLTVAAHPPAFRAIELARSECVVASESVLQHPVRLHLVGGIRDVAVTACRAARCNGLAASVGSHHATTLVGLNVRLQI